MSSEVFSDLFCFEAPVQLNVVEPGNLEARSERKFLEISFRISSKSSEL